MLKNKKILLTVVSVSLGAFICSQVYAADTYKKDTTTVSQTTTQQTTSTAPRPVAKKAAPVTKTDTTTVTTKEGTLRTVLDEDALKKMSDTLCVTGFKVYYGNDNNNVCQGKASVPDIAYSCVWKEDGNAAYSPTTQGPCGLDTAEHKGSIIVTKNDYESSPPLPYGTEAQCCFRAAQGPATSTVVVSPTTTTTAKK